MIGCFNKKGALIKRSEWDKRIKSRSYYAYKAYKNGDIYVEANWYGISDKNLPPKERKIFRLVVSNMVNGKWVKDISLTEDFASVDEMLAKYESVLLEFTECELNDDFEFTEKGNIAEPIPIPAIRKPVPVVPKKDEEPKPKKVKEPVAFDEIDDIDDIDEIMELETTVAAPSSGSHLGEWS